MGGVNANVVAIAQRKEKFVPNDLHRGMRSGCNQLCVFMCGRRSGGVLATPTWSFECEEYLCIPKHVGGMNIGKISRRTSTLKNLDGG